MRHLPIFRIQKGYLWLELYDPSTNSDGDGFGTITRTEFLHDVLDMPFDRFFRDEEKRRYVAISISVGYLPKHLNLAFGQSLVTHMLRKIGGDLVRNMLFACMNLANHFDKLFPRHGLEHVALSTCLKCLLDFNVSLRGCKHDDPGIRKLGADGYHCVDAADVGHPQIHESNVRPVITETLNGFASASRLGYQCHVGFIPNYRCDSFPHDRMIVHAEDPDLSWIAHLCLLSLGRWAPI